MDFQSFTRRELQALCKLNKIPANITNVAMVDALKSLDIVVGMEDFLKPSQSSETNESSIESPEKTEVMSPRVPRTSCRTSTQQKPLRDEAETVKTVTRTTRRGVRRQIAGEVEESKTSNVPETPAVPSSRRRTGSVAMASRNMETQLKESEEDVKVDDSMDQDKKCVLETPVAVPYSRRKGPAASLRRSNLKEESVVGRTYSTRRSARLAEVKQAEPTPMEKERRTLEKINLLSEEMTQSFGDKLDEGSDDFNAVSEKSSLSGSGIDALTVGNVSQSELLELETEKISTVDTHMGTEEATAIDAKTAVLERSNDMEVDVIPSDHENPSELDKFENVENISIDKDLGSEETTAIDIKAEVLENSGADDTGGDVHLSENENRSEILKLQNVEENLGLVDVTAAETENGVPPDNKEVDNVYPSDSENPGEVATSEDIDSDVATATEMEILVLENNVEVVLSHTENLIEAEETNNFSAEEPFVDVENLGLAKIESDELKFSDFAFPQLHPVDVVENQGLAKVESDELKMGDSAAQHQKDFEFLELKFSDFAFPQLHPVDVVENQGLAKVQSDELKMGDSAAQHQNQDIEDPEIGYAAEEMSNGNATSANGETSQESLELAIKDIVGDEISGVDANGDLDLTELQMSRQLDGEKVADISEQADVDESVMEISADLSSFLPFTSIPSSEMVAISTQVPSTKTPTKSGRLVLVSDDKENIDLSGRKLQLPKDAGKKIKKDKTENDQLKKLHEASMRQLQKMLKEKLQISKSVNANEEASVDTVVTSVTKARPALQTLSSNSLAATEMGN